MVKETIKNRAWIEVNLTNLEHNINEIKKILPKKTRIMAVVKANAYGHGAEIIAKKLASLGNVDFAVATLEEAISLRKNKIEGNILILGYTRPQNIKYVVDYDLIQTVVDYAYFKELEKLNFEKKIKVHIKVNTGMNRIGISYKNISFIEEVYHSKSLNVLGIFSHLCVADSNVKEDREFTALQIKRFNLLIDKLKSAYVDVGKCHLQSSYGVLNYPELEYDYVRVGIIMYGVNSEYNMDTKIKLDLKPVLALKARISSIREIEKGETCGYGRCYKALEKERVATVTIGYADGYPRILSLKRQRVMVNGKSALVIGKICMDQLIIKLDDNTVKEGDVVTLIGEGILAEEVAFSALTITNELLSRLGSRLDIVEVL